MKYATIILLTIAVVSNMGCAGFVQFREDQIAQRRERSQPDWINNNWKGGYGFNNPNVERMRNGQEPLNFDGSLDSEDDDGYFNQLFGDLLAYGIKSGFSAIANSLRR